MLQVTNTCSMEDLIQVYPSTEMTNPVIMYCKHSQT